MGFRAYRYGAGSRQGEHAASSNARALRHGCATPFQSTRKVAAVKPCVSRLDFPGLSMPPDDGQGWWLGAELRNQAMTANRDVGRIEGLDRVTKVLPSGEKIRE